MWRNDNFLSSLLTIVTGTLCLSLKESVVEVALVIGGILLIVTGFVDLFHKQISPAVIKAVVGVVCVVFGLALVKAALYVLAALLFIYGVLKLVDLIKNGCLQRGKGAMILRLAEPIFAAFLSVCLFIDRTAVVGFAFFVLGLILLIKGLLDLVFCLARTK